MTSATDGSKPLSGVRIVELTTFGFVPSGVAIMADWGADVIKVEHPRTADPMRGLVTAVDAEDGAVVDTLMDHFNRGKRNIALDLGNPQGLEIFYELVRGAQVVVTSFLPETQSRLRVSFDDLRKINPQLIFAHGHGYGPRGPDANQPGFDGIAYWARGGVGHALTFEGGPLARQRAGFGDVMGGLSVATGVCAALYRQKATGQGCSVDVSLLAVACWQLAPDILSTSVSHRDVQRPAPAPADTPYVTSDGRYAVVLLLMPHHLHNVLDALGLERLLSDERVTGFRGGVGPSGVENEIRQAISALSSDELRARFDQRDIAWSIVQTPQEVITDRQVVANEYVLRRPDDPRRLLVSPPVQFDQRPSAIDSSAPAQGQHSRQILAELGIDEIRTAELLAAGVVAQGGPGEWDEFGRLKNA